MEAGWKLGGLGYYVDPQRWEGVETSSNESRVSVLEGAIPFNLLNSISASWCHDLVLQIGK